MDFLVIRSVFRLPNAGDARADLHRAVHEAQAVLDEVENSFVAHIQDVEKRFRTELRTLLGDERGDVLVALRRRVGVYDRNAITVVVLRERVGT